MLNSSEVLIESNKKAKQEESARVSSKIEYQVENLKISVRFSLFQLDSLIILLNIYQIFKLI